MSSLCCISCTVFTCITVAKCENSGKYEAQLWVLMCLLILTKAAQLKCEHHPIFSDCIHTLVSLKLKPNSNYISHWKQNQIFLLESFKLGFKITK